MKYYFKTLPAFVLLAFASCQQKTYFETEHNAAIKNAVEIQYMKLISALNLLDFSALSDNFSKDDFISAIIGEKYLSPYHVWKDSVSNWLSQRERQQIKLVEISVRPLTTELALMTSTTNWDILFKSGEQRKLKMYMSVLWKKENNSWKIVHLHESWEIIE